MRRLLALLLLPLLLLTACSSDETDDGAQRGGSSSSLADVDVTGDVGAVPTVQLDPPLALAETAREVLSEGDGAEVQDGDLVTADYLGVDGRTGETFDSSFDRGQPAVFPLSSVIEGFRTGLVGATVGSRVLVGVTPDDGYGPQGGVPDAGIEADDSLLFVVDVLATSPPRAQGETVAPVAGLPTVTLSEAGEPTVDVPGTDPPTDLVVQPLIRGGGEEVQGGDSITVQYSGVLWADGTVFDSTWQREAEPTSFEIGTGQVIPGWDQGLVGQTVGSQVLLVVPPSLGYGDAAQGSIPAGSTLVFVVDILAAVPSAQG